MLTALKNARRLLIEADLTPVQGERFQPTGFADLGAGTYQLPDGTQMLLVESAQSIANRLEAAILGLDSDLLPELKGLSYIKAELHGAAETTTSSLVEAHRINSPFIISDKSDKEFRKRFSEEADYAKGRPLDWHKIACTIFKYDLNSLLHGVFMSNLEDGRVRLSRAVSGFIEARGVKEVVTGGVKNNPFDPSGTIQSKDYDKDVYSNVPYQRVEYTAESITAFFNLDVGLLRSYDLGDDALDLLVGLALFKIQRFLNGGLRLRTACDFKLAGEARVTEPKGFTLPNEGGLLELVQEKLGSVRNMVADPPVTTIRCEVVMRGKKGKEDK